MNFAELAIRNRLICAIVIACTLAGGWYAFQNMARFEDPEFTIRTAIVLTQYPGATAEEVADEVIETLETAIQELQEVEEITSTSAIGLSTINVDVKYGFSRNQSELELVWTKLRRRVRDVRDSLPPGVLAPVVNDAFGDVYSIYYLVTGTTAQIVVDYWLPEGTDIARTRDDMISLEGRVMALAGVTAVQTLIGAGGLRYMLVYGPQSGNSAYGQLLVKVEDYRRIADLLPRIQAMIDADYPDAQAKAWQFQLGPGGGSKIEAEFAGPDPGAARSRQPGQSDHGRRWRRRLHQGRLARDRTGD